MSSSLTARAGEPRADVLEIAIRKSHDRLCTVTRTVELETPVDARLRGESLLQAGKLTGVMASPTSGRSTAPHLAQRDLVYVTPERLDEFFAAVVRGFHDDYVADELGSPMHKVFEPERSFGFQVDGRWISTCGAYSRKLTVPGRIGAGCRRHGCHGAAVLPAQRPAHRDDEAPAGRHPRARQGASCPAVGFGVCDLRPFRLRPGQPAGAAVRQNQDDWHSVRDVDLGSGSVGEVERDQAIPIIKRLHQDLLPRRVGALESQTTTGGSSSGTIPNSGGMARRRTDLRCITTTAAGRTATWRFESRTIGQSRAQRSASRNLMQTAR